MNLMDENVQMATLIYNDRINTWRKMKVLDEAIDQKPKNDDIMELAELRIRNLQCFNELRSFNESGEWKNEHPLLIHYSERSRLLKLKRSNPEQFLKEHSLCLRNITRYRNYLSNEKRQDRRDTDSALLKKHQERKVVFENLLNEDN